MAQPLIIYDDNIQTFVSKTIGYIIDVSKSSINETFERLYTDLQNELVQYINKLADNINIDEYDMVKTIFICNNDPSFYGRGDCYTEEYLGVKINYSALGVINISTGYYAKPHMETYTMSKEDLTNTILRLIGKPFKYKTVNYNSNREHYDRVMQDRIIAQMPGFINHITGYTYDRHNKYNTAHVTIEYLIEAYHGCKIQDIAAYNNKIIRTEANDCDIVRLKNDLNNLKTEILELPKYYIRSKELEKELRKRFDEDATDNARFEAIKYMVAKYPELLSNCNECGQTIVPLSAKQIELRKLLVPYGEILHNLCCTNFNDLCNTNGILMFVPTHDIVTKFKQTFIDHQIKNKNTELAYGSICDKFVNDIQKCFCTVPMKKQDAMLDINRIERNLSNNELPALDCFDFRLNTIFACSPGTKEYDKKVRNIVKRINKMLNNLQAMQRALLSSDIPDFIEWCVARNLLEQEFADEKLAELNQEGE